MKIRPRDKKAGIIFLAVLIIISLADIIFRAVVIGDAVYTARNLGEQLVVLVLAVTILIVQVGGEVFQTHPLSWQTWLTIILATSPVVIVRELYFQIKNVRIK